MIVIGSRRRPRGRVMDLIPAASGFQLSQPCASRRTRQGRSDALARLHGGRRVDSQETHHRTVERCSSRPPCPAPIRKLADRYLYEPVHVKVESATLTVETIDQVIVEVEPNRKLGRAVRDPGARPPRRRDRVPAPQDDRRRARRTARRARLRRRAAAWRHASGAARRRDAALPQRARRSCSSRPTWGPAASTSRTFARVLLRRPGRSEDYTYDRAHRPRRPQWLAYTFMTIRDRKGVAEIERVTGAEVRHFTADQVIPGEELKALSAGGRGSSVEAAAGARAERSRCPGRVTESVPAVHPRARRFCRERRSRQCDGATPPVGRSHASS